MSEATAHTLRASAHLTPLVLACALVLPQLAPRAALGRVEEHAVEISVVSAALKGQGWPRLIVTLRAPLASLRVELRRSDGQLVRLSSGRLGAGTKKTFELHQPDGAFQYEGRLVARFPRGPMQTLPLAFGTVVLPPPRLEIPEHPVDLAAHTVTFTADRPIATVDVRVIADDGTTLDDELETLPESKAGDPVTAAWKQPESSTVLEIDVRATDRAGFYQDISLYPWKVEIPHEDVLFETGSAVIQPSEQPKIDAAFEALAKALRKYGRFAKVELFVAGHTDTVGDAASNKALSEARALSIARGFRDHGATIPISYAGFGEEQLLVPTPDETAEPRNRRAAYIVSITPPPGVRWTRLAP